MGTSASCCKDSYRFEKLSNIIKQPHRRACGQDAHFGRVLVGKDGGSSRAVGGVVSPNCSLSDFHGEVLRRVVVSMPTELCTWQTKRAVSRGLIKTWP